MRFNKLIILILVITISRHILLANELFTLKGKVIDSKTNTGLPGVIVRILNTNKGTTTDDNGYFQIILEKGNYNIQFSIVGYNSEERNIILNKDIEMNISLDESFVQLSEVLVVAEDPGVGIIRRAIAYKKKWIEKLFSYKFTAYTKQIISKEDSIASIGESYSNGFWRKSDGFREIIFQKKQTENIKIDQNFAMVGGIINFNEDIIEIAGYKFTGPTSANALEDYSFKLLKTYESRGFNIYEIQIKPSSRFKPLFDGIICISDSIYSITKVELKPNDVFKIPFVKDFSLNISQRFNVYDSIFWMPVDISIDAKFAINIPGVKIPPFGFKQRSILYDYEINKQISDTIFFKEKHIVDTTSKIIDTTYWETNRVLPLSSDEEKAYKSLDSTKTLDKQFRPSGILMSLENNNSINFLNFLKYTDFHFNRVEGYYLGGEYDEIFNKTSVKLSLGYGFSEKKWKYLFSLGYNFSLLNSSIYVSYYNKVFDRPNEDYYSPGIITIETLLTKEDYGDYYKAEGYEINYNFNFRKNFSTKIKYRNENDKSITKIIGHGLLSNKKYRANLPISEGNLRTISCEINLFDLFKKENGDFIVVNIGERKPTLRLRAEFSGKLLRSDFDYNKYDFTFRQDIPTFLQSLFLKPFIALEVRGGFSTGKLPPQRVFNLESSYNGYAPFGTFRTMRIKEFTGNSFFDCHLEHNFRTLPFRLINWSWMEEQGIETIIFGSIGRTWLNDDEKKYLKSEYYKSTDGWYSEVGFGFSKILLFLRIDFAFKLTQKAGNNFNISFKFGNLL